MLLLRVNNIAHVQELMCNINFNTFEKNILLFYTEM